MSLELGFRGGEVRKACEGQRLCYSGKDISGWVPVGGEWSTGCLLGGGRFRCMLCLRVPPPPRVPHTYSRSCLPSRGCALFPFMRAHAETDLLGGRKPRHGPKRKGLLTA